MLESIKVSYKSTNNLLEANRWLRELGKHPELACDFEVSTRYDEAALASFQGILDDESNPKLQRMEARAKLRSNALGHPSHTQLTHLSVAWNETDSIVFILDRPSITRRILQFLITTNQTQIWHNASFDLKHIYYYMGAFPRNFEDTQIYTKTLVNHVEILKATTGLKELAGPAYGAWGISTDNFHYDQMYEPKVLLYAATDACATFWIWNRIKENTND